MNDFKVNQALNFQIHHHLIIMQMKNKFLVSTVLALLVLVSCSKNRFDTDVPVIKTPTKISDLVAPASFTWSTAKTVTVNVTGLPTLEPVKSTLIIGLTDGTQLYKSFHDMGLNLTVKVTIPAIQNALKITYGSMTYEMPVIAEKADFSFIPDTNN